VKGLGASVTVNQSGGDAEISARDMRLSPEAADTASLIATSLKERDQESHEPIANSPTTYAAMFSQSIMRASV
jgi:hypothetical protein